MTPQENQLIAMKKMAEWRIKKVLKGGSLYESMLFHRTSRGLRRSDWDEVVAKLVADGVVFITRSDGDARRVPILSLNQTESGHGTSNLNN